MGSNLAVLNQTVSPDLQSADYASVGAHCCAQHRHDRGPNRSTHRVICRCRRAFSPAPESSSLCRDDLLSPRRRTGECWPDSISYTISLPRSPRPQHVGTPVEVRDRSRSETATTRPRSPYEWFNPRRSEPFPVPLSGGSKSNWGSSRGS
jgi:hypothetical protein